MSQADALAAFARSHVAPRKLELIQSQEFPMDLWAALGRNRWLGFGMAEHGGLEATPEELFETTYRFADAAEVMGFSTPWMTHHMVALRIFGAHADPAQEVRWAGRLARGESSACIAISEPGAGAHPKRLTTRAEKTATGWRLNGEKAWLTNGPLADLFIVVAITEEVNGRKKFGAFLVPENTPGLTRTAGVPIEYVHPLSHCGLMLENVDLPEDACLTGNEDAVETVLKRFRRVEDTIGLAVKAAVMGVQLRHIGKLLGPDSAEVLGVLNAERELYLSGGRQLMADSGGDPVSPEHEARLLALRRLGRRWQAMFGKLLETVAGQNRFLDILSRDAAKMGEVAERVDQAKLVKAGTKLIG